MPVSNIANSDTFKVTAPSDREVRITRVFDAPRALVYEAFTNPKHVRRWWGCLGEGYSVPVCEADVRPGGKWRYVNKTPKGDLAAFNGEYRELAPPERLVFTEIYEPYPDAGSLVTVVFTEENGKTLLTLTAEYPSIDVRDMVLKSGMEYGAALSYDRLEEIATELQRNAAR